MRQLLRWLWRRQWNCQRQGHRWGIHLFHPALKKAWICFECGSLRPNRYYRAVGEELESERAR